MTARTMSDPTTPPLTAERLRDLFAGGPFTDAVIDALVPYYADDVVFTDPIQTVRGRDEFVAMNRRLLSRAKHLQFDVRDMAQEGDQVFLTWTMTMQPKPVGPELRIEGVTHCVLRDGKVVIHRDYWDLLGSVMDTIPLAGTVYKAAVRLLG
jgi:limonene-1,2-epoxide hydrolase